MAKPAMKSGARVHYRADREVDAAVSRTKVTPMAAMPMKVVVDDVGEVGEEEAVLQAGTRGGW